MQQQTNTGEADPQLIDLVEDIATRYRQRQVVDEAEVCRAHPQYSERLARLLPTLKVLADLGVDPPAVDVTELGATPTGQIGDFRIVREIGRGGMGIIYEAEQISLGRTVALKVLPLAAMLSERQLQRFKNEARAAATLHHSNIVPIYAVGTERGVHFYAMQLIRGNSLAEVIEQLRGTERAIDDPAIVQPDGDDTPRCSHASIATDRSDLSRPTFFRSVAQLGIQAAEALQHAHEHGVVHRDIKPGNLLLDAESKLWITDFGLAQLQQDAGVSLSGDVVGTLRYMSPEQTTGRSDAIDGGTDIYSLGATLYELLTLEPAFRGNDRQQLLRQICSVEPDRLRQRNRAVPRELETIVGKAMAKERSERYRTAGDLASDLRSFLECRPILAQPPTIAQRLMKWSRRHQAAVIAFACVMLLAVVGLVVSNLLIARQRNDARQASQMANDQRHRAEANLQLALLSINDMLTRLANVRLQNVPQLHAVRMEMSDRAVELLEQLARQNMPSRQIDREIARGYLYLGILTRETGNHAQCEQALRQSIALTQQLIRDSDDEPQDRLLLHLCHKELGTFLRDCGRFVEARAAYQESGEVVRPLQDVPRMSDKAQNAIATAHHDVGRILADQGEHAAAESEFRSALTLQQELVRRHDNRDNRTDIATTYFNLGGLYWEMAQLQPAEQMTRAAIDLFRTLLNEEPNDTQLRQYMADATNNLGAVLFQTGRPELACDAFREQIGVLEKLSAEYPEVGAYRADLAAGHGNFALLLRSMGRRVEAEQAARSSVGALQTLVERHPNVTEYRQVLAGRLNTLANCLCDKPDLPAAIECYRNAVAAHEALVGEHPEVTKNTAALATALMNLAKTLEAAGQLEESGQTLDRAIATMSELVDRQLAAKAMDRDTLTTQNNLAWLLATCPDTKRRNPTKAVELATAMVAVEADSAAAWNTLGVAQYRAGDWQAAIETLDKSIRLGDGGQACDFFFQAMAQQQLGNTTQARELYDRGVKWLEERNSTDPEMLRFRDEAAELLVLQHH